MSRAGRIAVFVNLALSLVILFVFWLGTLGVKKAPVEAKVPIPGRAPEPAVGH